MSLPRVYNLGSLNLDTFLHVPHFVEAGETLSASRSTTDLGGKGLNQSVALARAGAAVRHIGAVGEDGGALTAFLSSEGVDVSNIKKTSVPTGAAFIQMDSGGQNAIVVHSGANATVTPSDVAHALEEARLGDWFLCQNETSSVSDAIKTASSRGIRICFNAAPCDAEVASYPLDRVDLLILNEDEAEKLTGQRDPHKALLKGTQLWPSTELIVTLGAEGLLYSQNGETLSLKALPARVVDTTAAGDTFVGFFLAARTRNLTTRECLDLARRASARCVESPGASLSIPRLSSLT